MLFTASCAPASASPTPQVVGVHASAAVQPWLSSLYDCAAQESVVIRLVDLPSLADIRLRIGEPGTLDGPAYEIASEDILVLGSSESGLESLDPLGVRELFAGRAVDDLTIWIFDPAEDVQQVFNSRLMEGAQVTSLARLAASPQQMADALAGGGQVVGILPQSWKPAGTRELSAIRDVPVLALVQETPTGILQAILACLQK
jgi:hypothetical protein